MIRQWRRWCLAPEHTAGEGAWAREACAAVQMLSTDACGVQCIGHFGFFRADSQVPWRSYLLPALRAFGVRRRAAPVDLLPFDSGELQLPTDHGRDA